MEHRARPYSILTSSKHGSFSSDQTNSTIRGGEVLITGRMTIGESIRVQGDVEVIMVFALKRDSLQVFKDIGQTSRERITLGIATRVAENTCDACLRGTRYLTAEQKQADHSCGCQFWEIIHLNLFACF
ncbi:hypothetical protein GQ457_06G029390 [Hibiscus cannabinus]